MSNDESMRKSVQLRSGQASSRLPFSVGKANSRHTAKAWRPFLELSGAFCETPFRFLQGVHNHFGSGLARFKLGAHFLDLCGLRLENLYSVLQLLDFAMFFEDLIEHHCVDSLPEHGIHLVFANCGRPDWDSLLARAPRRVPIAGVRLDQAPCCSGR